MLSDAEMMNGFIEEAQEHMAMIESGLLKIERDPEDHDNINQLFRSVHTIKGGAGFFGLDKITQIAHAMESLLSKARENLITITSEHTDMLLAGYDLLSQMLGNPQNLDAVNIQEVHRRLEQLGSLNPATPAPAKKSVQPIVVAPEKIPEKEPEVETRPFALTIRLTESMWEGVMGEGLNLYGVRISLKDHLNQSRMSIAEYINEIQGFGKIVNFQFDVVNIPAFPPETATDISAVFLFSSILDSDVVSEGLRIQSGNTCQINTGEMQDWFTNETDAFLLFQQSDNELKYTAYNEMPLLESQATEEEPAEPAKQAVPATPAVNTTQLTPSEPASSPAVAKAPVTPVKDPGAAQAKASGKIDETIRVSVSRLNKLVDLAGELVLARNQILRLSEPIVKQINGLSSVLQNFNMVTTELQEEIMNTRMQPIGMVFGKFPRMIRELSQQLNKKIQLVTEGNDVELDKTIIESLSDPMTHIIRNTADHGIELPEVRLKKNKPEQGTVKMKAYHESGQVIVQVMDDGKGIDVAVIVQKAVEKGVITAEMVPNMSDKDKLNLVFAPGFSTAEKVSSVSGRGVGMDVVKSNIEQLGGTVEVSSEKGKGTTLTMTLPLTMAIVSCLIVKANNQRFAIPQVSIEELVMLKPQDHQTMIGEVQGNAVLRLRGKLLPLLSLTRGLGYAEEPRNEEASLRILIVKIGSSRVGVIVDEVLGSEEIVVKPMPEYLKHLRYFSGATILGDGAISLIMDIPGFVEKNQLLSSDQLTEDKLYEDAAHKEMETQSILIFDNGSEEQFGLAIPLIRRIDDIEITDIQHIGDKEYIEYRGEQMRILRLEDYLPIQQPKKRVDNPNIIIPKQSAIPIGILINRVIDTKNLHIHLEKGSIKHHGIIGTTLIDRKITLILDLYAVLEMGEPESVVVKKMDKFSDKKVLLVEDTPFFLTIVTDYLKTAGFHVVTATNGKEALEILAKQTFDLVLSDIEMPVMNGLELIKNIRANPNWQRLPVLALTSINDANIVNLGKEAGFNEWLVKLDKENIYSQLIKYV
ncbi:MAG: chemotaxis protein CheW [SAR324 cluster bacterium]|nr:chemotaxis protein CheW [SAR324 cluster bacterium]